MLVKAIRTHYLAVEFIIVTPLAIDEFNGPRGDFYKNILKIMKRMRQ